MGGRFFSGVRTLINIVLVLGMCFFAGGLRFAEQGFDASEKDVAIVEDSADIYPSPSSSCDSNSFFTLEHQRRGCSHACSLPFLSELANAGCNSNRSEIGYFEHEPWCMWFAPQTRENRKSDITIQVSVVLVAGATPFCTVRCILIRLHSILRLPLLSILVTHIPLRRSKS